MLNLINNPNRDAIVMVCVAIMVIAAGIIAYKLVGIFLRGASKPYMHK